MIRQTFQLIPSVGPWREKDLWARGICTWADFPKSGDDIAISAKKDDEARERIALAGAALEAKDLGSLARLIPAREHWRLYDAFADSAVFFDIEAEGVTSYTPTVVSLFHKHGMQVFIQGRNLDELPAALALWPIWVTFNGSCFDVPHLKTHFENLPEPVVHLDLRFLCRKAGLKGGLKEIEDTLGIGRPAHLRGVNGLDAIVMWRHYQRTSSMEALRLLVEYNLYDAFQLRTVMDHVYNRAAERLSCEIPRRDVFDRGEILYDVSKLLQAISPTERDLVASARLKAEREEPATRLNRSIAE